MKNFKEVLDYFKKINNYGTERQYWKFKYELSEIKEFKAEIMTDDETDYQI